MAILHSLYAAVRSEYFGKKEWQSWAKERLEKSKDLAPWMEDVSVAESKEELRKAIINYKVKEVVEEHPYYVDADEVIGYYYIMYKQNRLSLSRFFVKLAADDISDDAKVFRLPETIDMIEEAKGGKINLEKLNDIMTPLAEIARKQLEELDGYLK